MQLSKSYQLIRKLAAGGMAEVYLARTDGPKGFSKTLVIKRILPHLAQDEQFVEMFLGEARLVAQLSHPNVVQIFDFGEFDGTYHIAMEYIDGPNLRSLWRQAARVGEPLPPALCAKIISYACEGLAYAHDFVSPETGKALGLIHRDVSGDNILVSRNGAVKVVDFGIAKVLGQVQQTKTGTVRGKLPYMPPEQLQAKPLDRRVDVFALGMVLYELLSAKRPFDATGELEIMNAILYEPPKPIRQRRPDVPEAFEKVLQRALAKKAADRYPSCRHLRADLERLILAMGEPVGTYEVASLVEHLFPANPEAVSASAQTITEVNQPRPPAGAARAPPAARREAEAAAPKPRARAAGKRGARPVSQGLAVTVVAPVALPPPPPLKFEPPPEKTAPDSKGEPDARPVNEKAEHSSSWDSDLSTVSQPLRLRRASIVITTVGLLMTVSSGAAIWAKRSRMQAAREVTLPVESPSAPTKPVAPSIKAREGPPAPEEAKSSAESAPAAPDAPPPEQAEEPLGEAAAAEPPAVAQPPSTERLSQRTARAARASVVIEASPPAQIRVNGRGVGLSPVALRNLKPGLARVQVYDSIKGLSKEQTFMLEPGDNGVKRVVVGLGRLELRVHPSATVILNGRSLGRTPIEPLSLYEGMHGLKLESAEHKTIVVPVRIEAGKTRVLHFYLKAL